MPGPKDSPIPTESGVTSQVNTLLLVVTLGVLSWIGITTHTTSRDLAIFTERSTTNARELLELRARVASVELQLAELKGELAKR